MGPVQRNGKWGIDYYCQGRRVRKVVGTKAEARRLFAIRQGEIAEGRHPLPSRSVSVSLGRKTFCEYPQGLLRGHPAGEDRPCPVS